MEASAQPLRAPRPARTLRAVHAGPLTGLITQALLLAALAGSVGLSARGWVTGLACAVIMNSALAYGLLRHRCDGLRAADWVTLARASLALGVAALVADSIADRARVALLVSVAGVALALDFVDGWVARRARTTANLGAQFDGEVDAFLILVLSVYVARWAGAWVLAIGAARYAFLLAGWPLPWMRTPLPPRYWRKVVAATQGIVLVVAAANVLPLGVTQALLAGALLLLAESFGRDVLWLRTHHQVEGSPGPAVAAPAQEHGLRNRVAAAVTILAFLIVWAALVAPNRPWRLTPTAFVRVPVEGLVLVVLAVVLPAKARRALAALAGPALAVVVILKILDIGFFTAFARPFDPVGDLGQAGNGVETLRAALGDTEANLIVYGGVALAVALLLATTLSMFRLTRIAADNRRRSLIGVAALGAVWLLCSVSGAQLLPYNPIASASTASYVAHEVGVVQSDIHDEAVFARQIKHDPFRNTPGSRLLTALRGKDVLLVFVESYGRVAVQGSSFSPTVDALLANGTKRLQAAGFSAQSAFLTSSTFGGLSWLSHSTLQSGVWVNSERRYGELVGGSDRFTLSDAFKRAGWRTIDFAPADDRAWPEGLSFYHYDKLYDRAQLGYRGPTYNYAPMPDQYMFSALQRLELGKPHHRPLFAEVDTVSSHMPWNRIPNMIPWRDVGNGSIFNRHPGWVAKQGAFWPFVKPVRAAYARSLEYSLNTLISFVQLYGKKNLVLIVAGDEQPLAIVTGQGASHDVVASVIAHDPAVLKRIAGWGWQAGLLPSPTAPVWRMSAFRDRFLSAFDQRPRTR